MHKTFRPWAAAALLLTAGGTALAQPAPPPEPMLATAAAAAVASGTVQRLLTNPGGDIDGLLLTDGTQVNFPPQPARGAPSLRVGDRVSVTGWRTPVDKLVRATAIRGGSGSGTGRAPLIDAPRTGRPPPKPPGEAGDLAGLAALNTSGTIVRLLYTDRGDANGVLLDNGTLVRFPPHVGAAMRDTLQPGRPLHARGWGSRGAAGNAIEANAIGATAEMQDVLAGPAARPRPPRAPGMRPPAAEGAGGRRPPPAPAGDAPPAPPVPAAGAPVPAP